MKKQYFTSLITGSILLLASGASHAVVSDNLLTSNKDTTPWQNCDGSDLVTDTVSAFDPGHLEADGCAFRESPAVEGTTYKMTCGVSSFKYSSMTLAFHNEAGDTLVSETTEILEDVKGGAYSVTLEAPVGTSFAAVGIYGLAGSGFQDCTLLPVIDDPAPEDGSISGIAWFDEDSDTNRANTESVIPSTQVSILLNGTELDMTKTGLDGSYYFGGLDLDQCYQIQFIPADQTLTFTGAGGDNDAGDAGTTADICLDAAAPNVTDVDAGFMAVPPPAPPQDYAVCGVTWLAEADAGETIPNVRVTLINVATNEQQELHSDPMGYFSFGSLAAGDYKLQFEAPSGFEFTQSSNTLTANSSFAGSDGMTPIFNLPADSNSMQDEACTIRNANAGFIKTVVALDPTIANNDEAEGLVGETISVFILDNDAPCDGTVLAIDILGHNVPGKVSYDAATRTLVISDTTASGSYSVDYGLRGACGSYDTAEVVVVLTDPPPPPAPQAPDQPKVCLASIGKHTGKESGVHVDLKLTDGLTHASFSPQYNFYDADMNLVYTGILAEAGVRDWGIFWRKREHGIEVLDIAYVTAVANGVESTPAACVRQQVTPIAIDVDNSGNVETISGHFAFDMNGDGTPEQLGEWFSPTDGILIYKDFGTTISGEYMFGDTAGQYSDGFAKLAVEDLNDDGLISGSELQALAIWTDQNSNMTVDEGELSTLASHSIKSLSVEHYKYVARATLDNGKTRLMRDVLFTVLPIQQASR